MRLVGAFISAVRAANEGRLMMAKFRGCLILFLFGLCGGWSGAIGLTVTSFTVEQGGLTTGPFHVVVGEVTPRGGVQVNINISNVPADVPHRVGFILLDADGENHPLTTVLDASFNPLSPSVTTSGDYTYFAFSDGTGLAGKFLSHNLSFQLIPDLALPLGDYQVRAIVQYKNGSEWFTVFGTTQTSSAEAYYVFPDGSDSSINVKTKVSAVNITRPWLVASTATDSFSATVDVVAARYDEGSSSPVDVTVTVSGKLVDADGNTVSVKLSTDGVTFTNEISLVVTGLPDNNAGSYATAVVSDTLYYRPTSTFDYLSGSAELRLSVVHDDASSGGPTPVAGVGGSASALHAGLSGNVTFGDVATQLSSIGGITLPANYASPAYIDLVGAEGSVNVEGHTYGPNNFKVEIDSNGDAYFSPGGASSSISLTAPSVPDTVTVNSVLVNRGPITLDENGAEASAIFVRLPIGLGWMDAADSLTVNARLRSFLRRGPTLLSSTLRPEAATLSLVATGGVASFYLIEESKPIRWGTKEVEWTPSTGQFQAEAGMGGVSPAVDSVHGDHWYALEQAASTSSKPGWAQRASNRGIFRSLRVIPAAPLVVFLTAQNGEAVIKQNAIEAVPADPLNGVEHYLHFPQGTVVDWKNGGVADIQIEGDLLSGEFNSVDRVYVPYNRSIVNACYPFSMTTVELIPSGPLQLTPDGGLYDPGATFAAGSFALEWGSLEVSATTVPVHSTVGWNNAAASFASAGIGLVEEQGGWNYDYFSDIAASAVGILTHSGVSAAGATVLSDRPLRAAYTDGSGDYAGLNLREATNGTAVSGVSYIGGERIPQAGNYSLKSNAKYYVRLGGVSGAHDVDSSSFAGTPIPIYGYDISFRYFGLAYLNNLNAGPDPISGEDFQLGSTVSGGLEFTSGPLKNFAIEFDEMSVTGDGQLGEATPTTTDVQPITYWGGGVKVQSVAFANEGGCTNEALLMVGVEGYAAAIDTPLHGYLGIASAIVPSAPASGHTYGAGHLVNLTDAASFNLRPRLRLPSRIHVRGPLAGDEYETYTLTPSSDAYYSLYDAAISDGFMAFPALMDVSFFEDLEVHVRTAAASSASVGSANLAKIRLSGGWSDAGQTFWTDPDFDGLHQGFDGGDLDAYWEENHEDPAYEIVARQQLFGLIPLEYVVEWDSTMRKFGAATKEFDILVLNAKNKLEYLSANRTNISFGIKAEVDGIPDINLGTIAFNAVDEATGALESVSEAAQNEIAKYLDKGMGYANELIADAPDALFERMWELGLEPMIGDGVVSASVNIPSFVVELQTFLEAEASANFDADLLLFLEERFNFDLSDNKDDLVEVIAQVLAVNSAISGQVDELGGMVAQVEARLLQLQNAIRSITSVAIKIPDPKDYLTEAQLAALDPALYNAGDSDLERTFRWQETEIPWNDYKNYALAQPQVAQYVEDMTYEFIRGFLPPATNGAEEYATDTICRVLASLVLQAAEEMNIPSSIIPAGSIDGLALEFAPDFLNNFGPILQEVRNALLEVDDVITELLEGAAASKQLLAEVQEYLDLVDAYGTAAQAQLEDAYKKIEDALQVSLSAKIKLWYELDLGYFSTPEFEAEFNLFLKQELKDIFMESDIVIGIQTALRQHVQDVKAEIENRIEVVFAQVEAAVKAELTGLVASLDLGTIDTSFLSPFDEIAGYGTLDGFLTINGDRAELLRMDAKFELKAPEAMRFQGFLEIKALDLLGLGGCDYGGEEATEVTLGAIKVPFDWLGGGVKMDVFTSFSFDGSGPRGFGGGFDMVEGSLNFETFEIYELGAAAAFGADENYLAAKAGMKLKDYSVAGGVFFGKSCTIDPVAIAHEETAEFLYNESGGSFTGALVYGFCKIPISEALGIPSSCMFRISAGMGAGAFYFVEGPTFGGIMDAEVSGEALCVVSIKGEVGLIGAKVGNDLRFQGKGKLSGKAGACPFCVKFGKQVKIEYVNSKWKVKI